MMKNCLYIICLFFVVCQVNAQKKPVIDRTQFQISSNKVRFDEKAGNTILTVKADKQWAVTGKPAPWLKLTILNNNIKLHVSRNEQYEERRTSFTLTSGEKKIVVKVFQNAATKISELTVSSNNEYFPSEGGERRIRVESTTFWEITPCTMSWCSLVKESDGIVLKVTSNPTTRSRSDFFMVKTNDESVKVVVEQAPGSPDIFDIHPRSAKFASNGGEQRFTVKSSKTWRVSVNCAPGFELVRNGNELILKAQPNYYSSLRRDYFEISSGNNSIRVDISQAPNPIKFGVSANTVNFEHTGGTKRLKVTSPRDWKVESRNLNWCKLKIDGDEIVLNATINNNKTSRNGTVVISSGNEKIEVNVIQKQAPVKFQVANDQIKVGETGGDFTIKVTAPGAWSLEKPQGATWYTLSSSRDKISISVSKNTALSNRRSTFKVKSGSEVKTINVVQDPGSPTLFVDGYTDKYNVGFSEFAGNRYFRVWTNSSDYSVKCPYWGQIKKTADGFNFVYGRNESSYDLEGQIIVTTKEGRKVVIDISQNANSRKKERRLNGGTFMWAANYDFEIGANSNYYNFNSNLGFGFKIGNYRDFMQLELGAKIGVNYSRCYFDSEQNEVSFRLPLYARLKMNLFTIGNGKAYISGLFDYNIIRNKDLEDDCQAGLGLGVAYRNFEWEIYAKRGLSISSDNAFYNQSAGLSLRCYW